jgi:hypothetical protein
VAFSADGKTLASGGLDGALRLWDAETGKELRRLQGHPSEVGSVVFTPDGQSLLSCGSDTTIRLWDTASGNERRRFSLSAASFARMVLSPDGRLLALKDHAGNLRLWDVFAGKEVRQHEQDFESLAFAPDSRTLATGTRLGTTHLWDTGTGRRIETLMGHLGTVFTLAFAPDGKTLASGAADTTALIWDTSDLVYWSLPATKATARELETWWAALAADDAAAAHRAVWSLAAASGAVPFLKERLRPVVLEEGRITRLVRELDDNDFQVRERASRDLEGFGELAEPGLRKALAGGPAPEVRRRIEELLEKRERALPTGEGLRSLRAVQALEYAATEESRRVLASLAEGAPEARLTQEVRRALDRLDRQSNRR